MTDQAYYVANINYGPQLNALPEAQIVEYIIQAEARISQIKFQWVRLSQPPVGSCFLIVVPPNVRDLPDDGYLWQDYESVRRISIHQCTVEICSRDQGYRPNDNMTSICKRRLKIINSKSQLQFVHYLSVDPSARVPVKGPQALPTAHMLHQMQQQQSKAKRPSVTSSVDPNESFRFIGDDLDTLTVRDIASVRFKRNHHFLADIFSPVTVSDIYKEQKSLFGQDPKAYAEAQKKKLDELENECRELESSHHAMAKEIREESKRLSSALASITNLKTPEDVKQAVNQFESEYEGRVIPAARVMRLHLKRDPNANLPNDDLALDVMVDDLLVT